MKELGKYLIPFIVLVFVIHNKAHCQFLHHAVTLMQAYSYEKYDSLSHSKL